MNTPGKKQISATIAASFLFSYVVLKPYQMDIAHEIRSQASAVYERMPEPVQDVLSDMGVRLRRLPSSMAPCFFEKPEPKPADPKTMTGQQRYLSTMLLDW